jgi:hypothetical protein
MLAELDAVEAGCLASLADADADADAAPTRPARRRTNR